MCHFIEAALKDTDYPLEYVHDKLTKKESLLWIVWDGKTIHGAGTTEICGVLNTDKRVCVITSFGGRREHFQLVKRIEQYAREEKCELVRLYGPKGWARMLGDQGYEQPWIALEKRL